MPPRSARFSSTPARTLLITLAAVILGGCGGPLEDELLLPPEPERTASHFKQNTCSDLSKPGLYLIAGKPISWSHCYHLDRTPTTDELAEINLEAQILTCRIVGPYWAKVVTNTPLWNTAYLTEATPGLLDPQSIIHDSQKVMSLEVHRSTLWYRVEKPSIGWYGFSTEPAWSGGSTSDKIKDLAVAIIDRPPTYASAQVTPTMTFGEWTAPDGKKHQVVHSLSLAITGAPSHWALQYKKDSEANAATSGTITGFLRALKFWFKD